MEGHKRALTAERIQRVGGLGARGGGGDPRRKGSVSEPLAKTGGATA